MDSSGATVHSFIFGFLNSEQQVGEGYDTADRRGGGVNSIGPGPGPGLGPGEVELEGVKAVQTGPGLGSGGPL